MAGKGRNDIAYIRANKLLPEKLDNLRLLETQYAVARRKLDNLKRRRNSAALSKDVRRQISSFIKSDREDLGKRREFNLWMRDTNLTFVIDTASEKVFLGTCRLSADNTIQHFYEGSEEVAQSRLERPKQFQADRDEMAKELEGLVKQHGFYKGWRLHFGIPSPWELMDGLPEGQLVGMELFGHLHLLRVPPKDKFPDPMSKEVWGPPQ